MSESEGRRASRGSTLEWLLPGDGNQADREEKHWEVKEVRKAAAARWGWGGEAEGSQHRCLSSLQKGTSSGNPQGSEGGGRTSKAHFLNNRDAAGPGRKGLL